MVWSREFWTKTLEDPTAFWTLVMALATIILVWVAYIQLRSLVETNKAGERTSKADFIYRLKLDFFTRDARELVALVDWNLLEFHRGLEFGNVNLAYFRVLGIDDPQIGPRLKDLGITYSSVATQTVDDVLLGPLEDVGMLLETNIISFEQAYDEFSSYVEDCAENEAIQAYISYCREEPDNTDVWNRFTNLYKRFKAEGPRVRKTRELRRSTVEASV